MPINKDKYRNAILFFLKYCNNQYLGLTKLNKLIYYLDFVSFRDTGRSVTGDIYVHKDYGPVPDAVDTILRELREDGSIDIEEMPYAAGFKAKLLLKKEPDLKAFSTEERTLLETICKELALWPTEKIVNQTHLEAPWFFSKPFQQVDYKHASDIDLFAPMAAKE